MKYANVELHNVAQIVETNGEAGFTITRLPAEIVARCNQGVKGMAWHGTGVEIRGMLPAGGEARVVVQTLDDNVVPPVATVLHGGFSGQAVIVGHEPTEITIKEPAHLALMEKISDDQGLPFHPRLVRVCLPPIHPTRILRIEGDLTCPPATATPSKTMLCYGSSITHGAHAIAPHGTYAAQCATRLGVDLVNLGFGGSAQMDAAIAEHIASRNDWDFATLEMGINVRTWPTDQFRDAAEPFVATIAAAHPDKPIFCIDLFTYFSDFVPDPDDALGFRDVVREIVAKHTPTPGSSNLHYVDGRTILRRPYGLQVDLVHPNDNGMQEMGRNLATLIADCLA